MPRISFPRVYRFSCTVWMARLPKDSQKEVFNGDIGVIEKIDPVEQWVFIPYDDRLVSYDYGEVDGVSLVYAITIDNLRVPSFLRW